MNSGRCVKITPQKDGDMIGRTWTSRETRDLAWVCGQLSLLFMGPLFSWIMVILLSAFMVSFLMIPLEQWFLLIMKNNVKGTKLLRSFWFCGYSSKSQDSKIHSVLS